MFMQQSIVKCESGLYNRQATYFIQKANEFKSSIWIEVEERRINAKSLLGVLSMGITKGTRISLIAEGSDEEEAVNTLTEMLVKEIFRSQNTSEPEVLQLELFAAPLSLLRGII